jgi:NAD(P)-dependent dehydrogenase (short-subunit alcohol dehydrogenase family)
MLIATGTFRRSTLAGRVAIVTGAGGGIGFETARALLWLGASVTIAEIDRKSGSSAVERLKDEFGDTNVLFVETDVSDEGSVTRMVDATRARFGPVDILINNATVAPAGQPVAETPIASWDRSYAVNLRGPVLLTQSCLPSMLIAGRGVLVSVSSTGGPYLGAYETLKAAQLTLAETLDAEMGGTGVFAFTIGPGLVATETATGAIERVAPKLGLSLDEFYSMNRGALVSVEAAGAGFAAAVVLAERYAGQEISSTQALIDAGIAIPDEVAVPVGVTLAATVDTPVAGLRTRHGAVVLCATVTDTLTKQEASWQARSFFERQWMVRDFRKRAGMPIESWIETLRRLGQQLDSVPEGELLAGPPPLPALSAYYAHIGDLARGYVKNPAERDTQLALIRGWQSEVEQLQAELSLPNASPDPKSD